MTRRTLLSAAAAALLLLPAIAFPAVTDAGANPATPPSSGLRQFEMSAALSDGTHLSITIAASSVDEARARAAMSGAVGRADSFYRGMLSEGGVADQLNALSAGKPMELSPDAYAVISKAVDIAAVTGGWYDPAGPSPSNWLTQRDWRRIRLDDASRTITFRSDGMKLDLRAISLGYAADIAMESITGSGFANARVEAGSICRIAGRDIFTPWKVQIGFGETGKAGASTAGEASKFAHRAFAYNVTNIAAATVTDEGLGAGLIDPKSKKPVASRKVKSVTVLAADATTAATYGLAAWTLGPRIGMRFIEQHPEVKGVLVDNDGRLFASEGLGSSNAPAEAAPDASAVSGDAQTEAPKASHGLGPADLKQKQAEEERDL